MNPQRLNPNQKNPARKGIVLPLTGVLLILLIPVVGLAIDASVLYVLKARLSAATDASAIAAARSLNVGLTLAAQEASARARALAFFNANFPLGSWATKNQSVTVTVAETAFRTRTVTVNAYFDAPQYFMRMLGFTFTRVRAEGKASRRDINLMLVLDRSSSMNSNGACTAMKDAAKYFVSLFAEGRDRIGLITFGESYFLGFAPSMTFYTPLPAQITSISCGGNTSTAMALWQAYQQVITINEPGALNLLVLFTDGYPNGVTADYPTAIGATSQMRLILPSSRSTQPTSDATTSAARLAPWNLARARTATVTSTIATRATPGGASTPPGDGTRTGSPMTWR